MTYDRNFRSSPLTAEPLNLDESPQLMISRSTKAPPSDNISCASSTSMLVHLSHEPVATSHCYLPLSAGLVCVLSDGHQGTRWHWSLVFCHDAVLMIRIGEERYAKTLEFLWMKKAWSRVKTDGGGIQPSSPQNEATGQFNIPSHPQS